MLWGLEENVIERFANAGITKEKISFLKDSFTFNADCSPSEYLKLFRTYYGPTMNAFEAAEKNGKAAQLQKELEELFIAQNKSGNDNTLSIKANFLRVMVNV